MKNIPNTRGFLIGEMSRRTAVHIETIRYYERIGLMPEPGRTSGGNRQYNIEQLKRLSFLKSSRELGFSIAEIRVLLALVDRDDFTCAEIHRMTAQHLRAVQEKISSLKKLEKTLESMMSVCSRGEVPDCPIIDALFKPAGNAP